MKIIKKIFLLLLLLGGLPVIVFSQSPESLFTSGSEAYRQADYKKAIQAYQTIRQQGKESGALYYNLGNSYFKDGQLGRAILNYERALRLLPRDSDLRFNYQYALKRAHVPLNEPSHLIEKALRAHVSFYTRQEMVFIMLLLLVGSGGCFLLAVYQRWPVFIRNSLCGILGVLLLAHVVGFYWKIQSEKDLAIMVASQEAKFEPRADATTHFFLPEGSKVKYLKGQDGWAKIQRMDGKLGWVQESSVEKI